MLRPNGWMDQDTTWYGGRPQPTTLCWMRTQWGPSFPQQPFLTFGPCLLLPNGRPSQQLLSSCSLVFMFRSGTLSGLPVNQRLASNEFTVMCSTCEDAMVCADACWQAARSRRYRRTAQRDHETHSSVQGIL